MEKIDIAKVVYNTHRDLDLYPINKEWVKDLAKMIRENPENLWPTYIGRWANGKFQICFGHHRLEALKLNKEKEIDARVSELSDDEMFMLMSMENKKNPDQKVTFQVLRHDIIQGLGGFAGARALADKHPITPDEKGFTTRIKEKMPWYKDYELKCGVAAILAELKNDVDTKELTKIENYKTAMIFASAAKKHKPKPEEKEKTLRWKQAQAGIADRVAEGEIGYRQIDPEFDYRLGFRAEVEPKPKPEINVYIFKDLEPLANKLKDRMIEINENIDSVNLNSTNVSIFATTIEALAEELQKFMGVYDEKVLQNKDA